MDKKDTIRKAFEAGGGIFRMVPTFVTRTFNLPGYRLKIHPDDYYAYGLEAGAVMERWFSSVNRTRNNNLKREDEGLSYILCPDGQQITLADAVAELKE